MQGKLLVVDDELFVREMLTDYFTRLNYQIRTAGGGKEALQLLGIDNFQAALIDLRMPDIGGIDLTRLIKESVNDLAIVLMSGYPTVDTVIDAMREGVSDFVIKPFRLKELNNTISRAIAARRLQEESRNLRERVAELEAAVSRLRARDAGYVRAVSRRRFTIEPPIHCETSGSEEPILPGTSRHRIREVTLAESRFCEEQSPFREHAGNKPTLMEKTS